MFIELTDSKDFKSVYINVNNISSFCCNEFCGEVYTNDGSVWCITKESYNRLLSKIISKNSLL